MVGRLILDQLVGVRVPAPQPDKSRTVTRRLATVFFIWRYVRSEIGCSWESSERSLHFECCCDQLRVRTRLGSMGKKLRILESNTSGASGPKCLTNERPGCLVDAMQ